MWFYKEDRPNNTAAYQREDYISHSTEFLENFKIDHMQKPLFHKEVEIDKNRNKRNKQKDRQYIVIVYCFSQRAAKRDGIQEFYRDGKSDHRT